MADSSATKTEVRITNTGKTPKVCSFCEAKKEPDYTDSASLKRYLSDRNRIISKARTGACSKHQRRLTKHIKYARHLSLLPFVAKV